MRKFATKCFLFIRNEAVLCAALFLAFLSCFFVPPSVAYFSYIDWDTLALLFSLMAVMKGFQKAGFFVYTANLLLKRMTTTRAVLFLLVFLPFMFSMVITNDVALITFVPFGLIVLRIAGQERLAVLQVVLQTIAANLGSMLTPMGNPQNLYLYNQSHIGFGAFCALMLPYVLASGICLAILIAFIKPAPISALPLSAGLGGPATLFCCAVGFALCLLGLFKIVSPVAIAIAVLVLLLWKDRKLLGSIDYSLLGTFFAFFIFVGNLASIPRFQNFLSQVLTDHVELVAILTSQIISNVPAALLLSGFTDQWRQLIIGCNLGGLGTLIASMASLISYKMIGREYPEQRKRYLRWFTLLNIGFLIVLFLLCVLLQRSA